MATVSSVSSTPLLPRISPETVLIRNSEAERRPSSFTFPEEEDTAVNPARPASFRSPEAVDASRSPQERPSAATSPEVLPHL